MENLPISSVLSERAKMLAIIRNFFDSQSFLEVSTPVRILAPAPEAHIDCPQVASGGFLRASPELQMKKLLAQGLDKIYQIGPCFRDGEHGKRHRSEFTMLEWYRKCADYRDIMDDFKSLCALLPFPQPFSPSILTVREAYAKFASWDPFVAFDQERFDFDMALKIEPELKGMGAVFLCDYPKECASLAQIAKGPDGIEYAQRWEFYFDGLEIANCFTELCSSKEQSERFAKERARRKQLGEADYPIDTNFIESLDAIQSAAGIAVGVDRLLMVVAGLEDIAQTHYCQ